MIDRKPQFGDAPSDEYDRDLRPDHLAGQNLGAQSQDARREHRTAFDVKSIHRSLSDWPDDELKALPVLDEGAQLQQGATYINLAELNGGEITATGGMEVRPGEAFIPKDSVPYTTWNRLRGIDAPDRTGGEPFRES